MLLRFTHISHFILIFNYVCSTRYNSTKLSVNFIFIYLVISRYMVNIINNTIFVSKVYTLAFTMKKYASYHYA